MAPGRCRQPTETCSCGWYSLCCPLRALCTASPPPQLLLPLAFRRVGQGLCGQPRGEQRPHQSANGSRGLCRQPLTWREEADGSSLPSLRSRPVPSPNNQYFLPWVHSGLWSGRAQAALWEVWVQPAGFLLPALHLFQDASHVRASVGPSPCWSGCS